MARVLLSAFSNVTWTDKKYHDGFTEGMMNALKRCGNDVLAFHLNGLLDEQFGNTLKNEFDPALIREKILGFNPDLIITFNNSLPGADVLTYISCPVAVYSADTPAMYADKEGIRKDLDKYVFLNGSRIIEKDIQARFSPKAEQMIFFGHATDMRALDVEQTENITYIGSMPNHSHSFINFFENLNNTEKDPVRKNEIKAKFYEALDRILEDEFAEKFDFDFSPYYLSENENFAEFAALCLFSCKNKFEILSRLTDLGLKIHGFPWSWPYAMQYNYELFRHFDYGLSVSLQQNMANFNKSKLCLNMPNATQKEGLSWRVTDILATSSVLLTKSSKTLEAMFEGYIDFPTYKSPDEARQLAIRLLQNDNLRKDLSEASQKMIDDKCRFEQRFEMIEQATGVRLMNDRPGTITEFDASTTLKIPYSVKKNFKQFVPERLKRMIRQAKNAL